ncbi:MAG: DUF503 domain-containing protein [Thermodesulfobacteriota bacterium]
MVVGVGRLHLRIHDNHSLKGKRQVVRKTIERVRSRFDLAIAEVGDQDLWQSVRLGFSLVGSDSRVVRSVMDRVVHFIEDLHLCEVLDVETEIMNFGENGLY